MPSRDLHTSRDPSDGRIVETSVGACPSCASPWPRQASHVRVGSEPCHGCASARFGVHRTRTCLSCGVEHLDAPCDRLGGTSTVQRLWPGWPQPRPDRSAG